MNSYPLYDYYLQLVAERDSAYSAIAVMGGSVLIWLVVFRVFWPRTLARLRFLIPVAFHLLVIGTTLWRILA